MYLLEIINDHQNVLLISLSNLKFKAQPKMNPLIKINY